MIDELWGLDIDEDSESEEDEDEVDDDEDDEEQEEELDVGDLPEDMNARCNMSTKILENYF